ncbi:uncharacterized protein BDV17DRAFT_284934 [Aspergillus undulatus]|uniref:uncharacterized protein n=1 Tax=Aspergillus undulatus TaxID=1810928 RepID=UPI003CCDD7B2
MSTCNVLSNPGFEAGLQSWYPVAGSVAAAATGDIAYAGSGYLDITTTVQNPTGTVSQDLFGLDNTKAHNFTVWVQLKDPISSVNQCTVSAYLGDDPEAGAVASDFIWNAASWVLLRGDIQPEVPDSKLNLVGLCTFSGEVTEAHVLFDEVVFAEC